MSDTKLCPYCREEIKVGAIKCKHCGSMLDEEPSVSQAGESSTFGTDLIGQSILGYRIEEELGSGGMGTVYRGLNEALGQRVAIKVLDAALSSNSEIRERFIQEARLQIGLRHPGIVQVLTADTESTQLALLMEYVEGLSLDRVIARRGKLPLDEALAIFEQVLDAVGFAHNQPDPVVHRDLKPSNIMVQANGTAKVMDFGIAKVMGGAKLTRTGTVMGSPHYMSPEQVLGQSDIGLGSDIYSLGITLYEMLCGCTPFEGATTGSTDSDYLIKDAHVRQAPPSPSEIRADIPGYVTSAIMRSLEKQPGDRFGSCAAFMAALVGQEAQSTKPADKPGDEAVEPVHVKADPPERPDETETKSDPRPRGSGSAAPIGASSGSVAKEDEFDRPRRGRNRQRPQRPPLVRSSVRRSSQSSPAVSCWANLE